MLSLEFNRLLAYYQNMPDIDLNASAYDRERERDGRKGRERGDRRNRDKDRRTADEGYTRLMVNVGKAQGFFPGNLMELVNRSVVGRKPEIGRIDLMPDYTLFDVRKDDAHKVVEALKNADFFGQRIRAEYATDRDYAAEAKDRARKRASKARKGDPETLLPKKPKKAVKEKKEKKAEAVKPKHGNYEIFYKNK